MLPAQADFVDPLPEGCPHSNVAVIGHFLAFLKDYLMEQLRRTYGGKFLTTHTIKYCFTIPAGWSEEAKFNIRQCVALYVLIVYGVAAFTGCCHRLPHRLFHTKNTMLYVACNTGP